jgi:asparagine synthase (glutamine-hydrolysing)
MSGIAGIVGRAQDDPDQSSLLDRLARSLRFIENAQTDIWQDARSGLIRVHHEATNKEPQPILNQTGTLAILFFGEIFDYEDDARRLARTSLPFRYPDNDAEFALRLYEDQGIASFAKLDGSFALAILDLRSQEILLVTDRFNSRPLFYALHGYGSLVFASQVSTVLRHPKVYRDIDRSALFELLHFQRVLGAKTLHKSVRKVPTGSFLRYREGKTSVTSYFQVRYRPENKPESHWIKEMSWVMRRAAERVTRGDHRFGMLLSGGLDSRMVLAASERELHCFTFGDFKNQEYLKAEKIALAKGFDCTFMERSPTHYVDMFDRAIELSGGMYSFIHAHSIGVTDQLREHCDFLLHGFAPELFFRGTNLPHVQRRVLGHASIQTLDRTITKNNLSSAIISKLKYSLHHDNPKQVFQQELHSDFDNSLLSAVGEVLREAECWNGTVYDSFLAFDTHWHSNYPSFLFETSIRPFIGERSIVFHNEVLDLHLRMPVRYRKDSRVWCKAIVGLDGPIGSVPDANTGQPILRSPLTAAALDLVHSALRKARLTSSIRTRPLEPGHSEESWPNFPEQIRHNGALQALIKETIFDPHALPQDIFDLQAIDALFNEHIDGRANHHQLLLLLLSFGGWNLRYGQCG